MCAVVILYCPASGVCLSVQYCTNNGCADFYFKGPNIKITEREKRHEDGVRPLLPR